MPLHSVQAQGGKCDACHCTFLNPNLTLLPQTRRKKGFIQSSVRLQIRLGLVRAQLLLSGCQGGRRDLPLTIPVPDFSRLFNFEG